MFLGLLIGFLLCVFIVLKWDSDARKRIHDREWNRIKNSLSRSTPLGPVYGPILRKMEKKRRRVKVTLERIEDG